MDERTNTAVRLIDMVSSVQGEILQITGLTTALRILFSYMETNGLPPCEEEDESGWARLFVKNHLPMILEAGITLIESLDATSNKLHDLTAKLDALAVRSEATQRRL